MTPELIQIDNFFGIEIGLLVGIAVIMFGTLLIAIKLCGQIGELKRKVDQL